MSSEYSDDDYDDDKDGHPGEISFPPRSSAW